MVFALVIRGYVRTYFCHSFLFSLINTFIRQDGRTMHRDINITDFKTDRLTDRQTERLCLMAPL